ncbi:hypothetical protein NHX12_018867 [Muraenolepis orangiensis]|uniref:Sodium channel and clathrin linker 1 n=1 Tax=Muraenolepis orangiensis TaxID=630683 RepID=A0A9Q0EXK5_9TELE|nr:hypothetical protein NHX12_018867 [Muraenolepis orangiensis]
MQAEVHQVQRLNSALGQHQDADSNNLTMAAQWEEARPTDSPGPWMSDRSVMAPLMEEYDRHMDHMTEQLHSHQAQMTDVKVKLERVVKENERLHAELRESVEQQLQAVPGASGPGNSTMEEVEVVKNLQEQIQLSGQEREQAMELWQTAVQELDLFQQLKDQLVQIQQHAHNVQVANQKLEVTNQQFVKTLTEQSSEMEELRVQLRQAKVELRTATAKVEETTKLIQNVQDRMQRKEEDTLEAQGREESADKRLQQLQSALSPLEARLKAASQEAEAMRRGQSVWERQVGELQGRCGCLEEEKYDALAKVRESVQLVVEATLQKEQALLREKQKVEELEKTKQVLQKLVHHAGVRTRSEVENVRKQCNIQIQRMAEELSALQLECADKESQVERALRERKAVEEELEKVYKDGRAEPEFRKIDALHQRCLDAERVRDDVAITLQSTLNKLKKLDLDSGEELARCQEEVRRLQGSLAGTREECVGVSEERLQLQRENQQLRREMDEQRKASRLVQKNAKQHVSELEQKYSETERGLAARVLELEVDIRNSSADMALVFVTQRRNAKRCREEAEKLKQDYTARYRTIDSWQSTRKPGVLTSAQRRHTAAVSLFQT